MAEIRAAIEQGRFEAFVREFHAMRLSKADALNGPTVS